MGTPFVGEIRMVGFNFAPVDWAFCNGQLMAIDQNVTLFQLIGTTYGGDGQNTFGLPNLQSRIPAHQGSSPNGIPFVIGELAGTETVTLTTNQIPAHSHVARCSAGGGNAEGPASSYWSTDPAGATAAYSDEQPPQVSTMLSTAIRNAGETNPTIICRRSW